MVILIYISDLVQAVEAGKWVKGKTKAVE